MMQRYWRNLYRRAGVALSVVVVAWAIAIGVPMVVSATSDTALGVVPISVENNLKVAQGEQAVTDLPVVISVFVRDDCQHCVAEKAFLADLVVERGDNIKVNYHDLSNSYEYEKFARVAETFGLAKGTPITLVGDQIFQGFDRANTTGALIAQIVDTTDTSIAPQSFDEVLSDPEIATVISSLSSAKTCTAELGEKCETGGVAVRVPIIGTTINLSNYSLSGISMVLGLIDGFNPCALWVLVMFLTLLLQAGSRRRMWQYAGLFIFAETVMYYLILTVWLNAWNFIGLSQIVTPLVGLLALGSGVYFLYKWHTWQPVCSVTSTKQQNKITQRITSLAGRPMTWGVVVGILALAFSVNIFEFACSIGIPQTFTKILEMNALTFWETQGQMALYIGMYMLDDVIVFALALAGAGKLSRMMQYSKIATLVGGLLMLVLGALMLFAPEMLVF